MAIYPPEPGSAGSDGAPELIRVAMTRRGMSMVDVLVGPRGFTIAEVMEIKGGAPDAEFVLVSDPAGVQRWIVEVRRRVITLVTIMVLAVVLMEISLGSAETFWGAFTAGSGAASVVYIGLTAWSMSEDLRHLRSLAAIARRRRIPDVPEA